MDVSTLYKANKAQQKPTGCCPVGNIFELLIIDSEKKPLIFNKNTKCGFIPVRI